MWDSLHTHTHYTINQIGVSQSPPLKSLTFSLGPTLWGSVSEPTRDYRASSDTICNDPRKSASHICAIPQKDQSLLRLLVVINKAQIYPVNTRCGTHYTPTHPHTSHNQSNWGITKTNTDRTRRIGQFRAIPTGTKKSYLFIYLSFAIFEFLLGQNDNLFALTYQNYLYSQHAMVTFQLSIFYIVFFFFFFF